MVLKWVRQKKGKIDQHQGCQHWPCRHKRPDTIHAHLNNYFYGSLHPRLAAFVWRARKKTPAARCFAIHPGTYCDTLETLLHATTRGRPQLSSVSGPAPGMYLNCTWTCTGTLLERWSRITPTSPGTGGRLSASRPYHFKFAGSYLGTEPHHDRWRPHCATSRTPLFGL